MNLTEHKKRVIFYLFAVFMIINIQNVRADDSCILDASLAYQDPYPAITGDYVEVLFQINGLQGNCEEGAYAELVLEYPFSLDSKDYTRVLGSSTYYGSGYDSKWNILYKIRIDENAVEGDYEIELRYAPGQRISNQTYSFEKFDISIEDGLTDFEVHVQNYKIKDRAVTFEILNTGNQDISALTIEIPKQDNVEVKGSNRNIVGDLDSEDYTTADFEAILHEGNITLDIYYTDSTNERRVVRKDVYYDSDYFVDSLANKEANGTSTYIVIGIIAILAILYFYRKRRHNKKKKLSF